MSIIVRSGKNSFSWQCGKRTLLNLTIEDLYTLNGGFRTKQSRWIFLKNEQINVITVINGRCYIRDKQSLNYLSRRCNEWAYYVICDDHGWEVELEKATVQLLISDIKTILTVNDSIPQVESNDGDWEEKINDRRDRGLADIFGYG